jgi:hypothetical protein
MILPWTQRTQLQVDNYPSLYLSIYLKGDNKKTFFKRILLRSYAYYNNGLHLILTTAKFVIQNGINQPCRVNTWKTLLHGFTFEGIFK